MLSFVLSTIGLVCVMVADLIKGKRMGIILFLVFSCNALLAISYLLDRSGINGAASCFLGALQALINFLFERKNQPIPKWLVAIYATAFVILNLIVGGMNWLCLLAIVASLTFIMSINQKDGAKYRIWTLANESLWTLYDILSHSYGALFTHSILVVTVLAGMIIYDRKKAKGEFVC